MTTTGAPDYVRPEYRTRFAGENAHEWFTAPCPVCGGDAEWRIGRPGARHSGDDSRHTYALDDIHCRPCGY